MPPCLYISEMPLHFLLSLPSNCRPIVLLFHDTQIIKSFRSNKNRLSMTANLEIHVICNIGCNFHELSI